MNRERSEGATVISLRPYLKGRPYPLSATLRALIAVASEGSITNVLQSSDYTLVGILTALRNLEKREGIRLLTQNSSDRRRLTLTPEGERLACWALEWFISLDELLEELRVTSDLSGRRP